MQWQQNPATVQTEETLSALSFFIYTYIYITTSCNVAWFTLLKTNMIYLRFKSFGT